MESKQNHWIGKLMMGIMGLILAFGAPKIIQIHGNTIQIKLLNIIVIVGDHPRFEEGSQTQTVTQSAKPESTAIATNQPVSEQIPYPPAEAAPVEKTVSRATVAQNSTVRKATPINYESDDECCASDDEEEAVDISNYSQAQAQSSVSVQGRNVSVQTSASGGETRTRIVVNGRVIVDQ